MPASSSRTPDTGEARVLVLSSDTGAAVRLSALLRLAIPSQLTVLRARGISEAIELAASETLEAAVFDLGGWTRPFAAIAQLATTMPDVPIVTVAPGEDEQFALQAIAAGADDHLGASAVTEPTLRRALRFSLLRRRSETHLLRAALRDPLTGLPNRSGFLDRVATALDRARRGGGELAVLLIAAERFSEVTDSVGHRGADQVLVELGARLRAVAPPADALARIGQAQFALLVQTASGSGRPAGLAEKIRGAAAKPIELDGGAVELTLDVAVRWIDDPGVSPHAVIAEPAA